MIERFKVTELMAVPTQIDALLSAASSGDFNTSSLRLIRTAGTRYPKSFVDRIREVLGCELLNTYGMTENCANTTAFHTAYDPYDKRDSIGKATYFWETRVIKIDPEREVEPEETITHPGVGQLIVRGPQNIKEYYQSPEEPLKIKEGWLYTRDVVEVDADGYLYIVDRIDNIIKSGAENIYPQEVEAVLMKHPKVADAAVIGVPHGRWGEVVVAIIKAGTPDLSKEEIDEYCLTCGELARYKRPRAIIFADEIPKNIFGKTDRAKLKEIYKGLRVDF